MIAEIKDEEEFNEGIKMWWSAEFQNVLHRLDDEIRECAKEAFHLNEINKGDKKLLCSVPTKLYNITVAQYGPDCWKNRDFIECYQKYAKQTFLDKPSYSFENQ